ncbi:MAG TPA: hypothetical protein VK695_04220 [Steroidobacteraceae bacterium]|jgi:hypothetical protein|nr:hypothetical protein [Steroidobacteraceae bacterium]
MVAIAVIVWAGFAALCCIFCLPLLIVSLTMKVAHADTALMRRLRRQRSR